MQPKQQPSKAVIIATILFLALSILVYVFLIYDNPRFEGSNYLILICIFPGIQCYLAHREHMRRMASDLNYKLRYFIRIGDTSAFNRVIHGSIDINHADMKGSTPLHLAVRFSRLDILPVLLSKSPDPFIKNKKGESPRFHALAKTHEEIYRILIDYELKYLASPAYTAQRSLHTQVSNPR